MKVLYIMQGIPGSGKSTVAQMIANATNGRIFSTDDLWYDEEGIYQFNAAQLASKHRENLRRASEAMVEGHESVIIDNTNLTQKVVNPYLMVGDTHGYTVQIIRVVTSISDCIARQGERSSDRRIPEEVIRNMYHKMTDLQTVILSNDVEGIWTTTI